MLYIILSFLFLQLCIWLRALYQTTRKSNAFGLTLPLGFLGIFVWGDGVVIAPFWFAVGVATLVTNKVMLFCVLASLFWVVRSGGEVVYWLLEQFSHTHRNQPHHLVGIRLFHNESIWFGYQVFWQCVLVLSLFSTLLSTWMYLGLQIR